MKRTLLIAALGFFALGVAWCFSNPAPRDAARAPAASRDAEPSAADPDESIPASASVIPPATPPAAFALAASSGELKPEAIAALAGLAQSQAVVFSPPNGTTRRGEVRTVQRDDDGWTRVGGAFADGGTFALSERDGEAAGRILLPGEDRAWQIRWADEGGFFFAARRPADLLCLGLPRCEGEVEPPVANGTFGVPIFDSRPSANAVLYLDFDGATVTDPDWAGGATIVAPPARLGANSIIQVCERVSVDYAAFDIDISTDPARYASTAVGHRMRAIVTRNDAASPGAGGVAYVGSFAHNPADGFSPDIPCWVFEDFAVNSCAEALSHELGHTLGLSHDGRDFPNGVHQEYYAGQGSGATGWAPIMGVAYYKRLTQWSKGEYRYANNHEDDIAIIAGSANGFGFIADEAGGTTANAAPLAVNGQIVDQVGVITNAQDIDFYRFTTGGGKLSVRARPVGPDPDIDILLELLDSTGAVLKSDNPRGGLAASLERHLRSGTYFLRISGTGKGNPLRTGYTNYGSIGTYLVTGKINGLAAAPFAAAR